MFAFVYKLQKSSCAMKQAVFCVILITHYVLCKLRVTSSEETKLDCVLYIAISESVFENQTVFGYRRKV